MARKRKEVKQKVMDPVTQEIYDLLHGNNSDAVDVVTAEYKVEAILDVTKLPPILDTSKLPPLDVVEVECPPLEVEPDFLAQYIRSMKKRKCRIF